MSTAMTDLDDILRSLDVSARPDRYVFATVPAGSLAMAAAHASIIEAEGVTIVMTTEEARRHGLDASPAMAWLTLTVHSSLEAVGLTAAFSTALAQAGISCNVLAGFYHDHLLVPYDRLDQAVSVLRALRAEPR